MHIFDWEDLNKYTDKVRKQFLEGNTNDPLFMHYLFDEPNLHKSNSEKFIKEKFKHISRKDNLFKNNGNNKIKIDIFLQTTTIIRYSIMSSIFKLYDKTKFELYGFLVLKKRKYLEGGYQIML